MRNLLDIESLEPSSIRSILERAQQFADGTNEAQPQGHTVVNCFFEDSTRTRVSFEAAAQRLGAHVINFAASGSSLSKGESFRDTMQTVDSMGVDAIVLRHSSAGAALQASSWCNAGIINAGDGAHEHPTQALLDCLTLRQIWGSDDFSGKHVGIIGDLDHSRVARSLIHGLSKLGAQVSVIGPPTLTTSAHAFPVSVCHDLDAELQNLDIAYTIRPQAERMADALIPSVGDYTRRFGLSVARFESMKQQAYVMEAGPLLRGVQMASAVADEPRCLINRQVANGIPTRMAVLAEILEAK
jgi:aspartate carbamoyltransferase catalytic subunit